MNKYITIPKGVKEDDCIKMIPEFLARVIKTASSITEDVSDARVRDSLASKDTFNAMYAMLTEADDGGMEHSAHMVRTDDESAMVSTGVDESPSKWQCDGTDKAGKRCKEMITMESMSRMRKTPIDGKSMLCHKVCWQELKKSGSMNLFSGGKRTYGAPSGKGNGNRGA